MSDCAGDTRSVPETPLEVVALRAEVEALESLCNQLGRGLVVPKTFRLGGHRIAVTLDKDVRERARMGEYYSVHKRMLIAPDLPRSQREETFLHEVVEAINEQHELELPHGTICTLAIGIHQALTSGDGSVCDAMSEPVDA